MRTTERRIGAGIRDGVKQEDGSPLMTAMTVMVSRNWIGGTLLALAVNCTAQITIRSGLKRKVSLICQWKKWRTNKIWDNLLIVSILGHHSSQCSQRSHSYLKVVDRKSVSQPCAEPWAVRLALPAPFLFAHHCLPQQYLFLWFLFLQLLTAASLKCISITLSALSDRPDRTLSHR